jgi:quinol monooxygenase YgiN
MSKPVRIVAIMTAATGQKNALRQVMEAFVTATRTEPGCLEFALHESLDDDHALIITETWADQHSLQGHLEGPAVRQMRTIDTSKLVAGRALHHLRQIN